MSGLAAFGHQVLHALIFGGLLYLAIRGGFALWRRLRAYRPCYVYHLPDAVGRVLYIGMAYDPDARLARHKRTQALLSPNDPRKWWPLLHPEVQALMSLDGVPDVLWSSDPFADGEWNVVPCVVRYPNAGAAHVAEVADIRRMKPPGNALKYTGVSVTDD